MQRTKEQIENEILIKRNNFIKNEIEKIKENCRKASYNGKTQVGIHISKSGVYEAYTYEEATYYANYLRSEFAKQSMVLVMLILKL